MKLISPEVERCHYQGFATAPLQVLIRRQLISTGRSPLIIVIISNTDLWKWKITAIRLSSWWLMGSIMYLNPTPTPNKQNPSPEKGNEIQVGSSGLRNSFAQVCIAEGEKNLLCKMMCISILKVQLELRNKHYKQYLFQTQSSTVPYHIC